MNEIRELNPEEIDAYVRIVAAAYPGMRISSEEDRERLKQRLLKYQAEDPRVTLHGLFREGRLLGALRLHHFTMNFLGCRVPAGGGGMLAVDLPYKKEHVARELMSYLVRHFRERGTPLAILYPFRPDFYKEMGFGYGAKMSQYRVRPAALPKGPSKAHVRYLGMEDRPAMLDCYSRFAQCTHGMIERLPSDIAYLMDNPQHRGVGYVEEGQIRGYLVFSFDQGESWLQNDLHVREFIYETPEALSELLTFLQTQADQVRQVVFDTQDESFYFLLIDPRNGSPNIIPSVYHESNVQGVGLMYKVIDMPKMFELLHGRNFGGQTCRLRLTVQDTFLPQNAGSYLLCFEEGRLRPADGEQHDVEIRLDIAEFSSLLVGAVDLNSLCRYGLAEVTDTRYVTIADRIFAVEEKPVCMTAF